MLGQHCRYRSPPDSHRLCISAKPLGISKVGASSEAIHIRFVPNPPIDPMKVITMIQTAHQGDGAGQAAYRVEARGFGVAGVGDQEFLWGVGVARTPPDGPAWRVKQTPTRATVPNAPGFSISRTIRLHGHSASTHWVRCSANASSSR